MIAKLSVILLAVSCLDFAYSRDVQPISCDGPDDCDLP